MLGVVYADCSKLTHCAECLYDECYYVECRGAFKKNYNVTNRTQMTIKE
jgi:hypothetical protein